MSERKNHTFPLCVCVCASSVFVCFTFHHYCCYFCYCSHWVMPEEISLSMDFVFRINEIYGTFNAFHCTAFYILNNVRVPYEWKSARENSNCLKWVRHFFGKYVTAYVFCPKDFLLYFQLNRFIHTPT